MNTLELKIPPPVVTVIIGAAMYASTYAMPPIAIDPHVRYVVAGGMALLGLIVAVSGSIAFRSAKTTVNPMKPENASSLVIVGVYHYTRNPMYFGLLSLLLGWAVFLAEPLALLGPVMLVLYLTRFQIIPEERALNAKFGAAYGEYQARVRRWL